MVSLPLTAVHAEPAPPRDRRQGPAPALGDRLPEACGHIAGIKILVVDDEPDVQRLLRRLLEDCEAEVVTASSAEEALGSIVKSPPDVLVSDIGMPGEDGFSLIRRIRELPDDRGGATPAIALTAYARAEDRVNVCWRGFSTTCRSRWSRRS